MRVELDGIVIGEQKTVTDDGRGAWLHFRSRDAQLLRKLAGGEHSLRFIVPPGPSAHGLCLYGDARDPTLPKTDFGPLRIHLRPAPKPSQPR